ncbi:DUF3502 domain-containing protein [Paenibacillus sp. J5C_2022]|uniref:DUF3502 domain-containing protein n=1 Tax=Paenibacillus sp. J5C2022 TaxID=2977129 RepID=UPI0021D0273E|nr:DUF3502 domain-containing protein [Paenibacillus sp. J5C2022]MCU6712480.1 DUF3502 domain-containing protein [Paenibacillus sp. J5C2022]
MKQVQKKKMLSISVALVLGMQLVLSACSSDNAGNPPSSKQPSTNKDAAVNSTEDPTKDFAKLTWYIRKPVNDMSGQAEVEAVANEIIKKEINAELNFKFIDAASWEDKMRLSSAAGEEYDIALSSNTALGNRLDLNVQRGAVMPLDDLLEKYGQDILKKVDPRAWKVVTFDGQIMGIPSQLPYSTPRAYVFKRELVEKYNYDYKSMTNKTLDELEPFLETIKQNEPDMIPLAAGPTGAPGAYNFNAIEIAKGIVYNEKTGQLTLDIDVPETLSIYRTLNDFYKKGYIAKDAATRTDTLAELKSGNYAVMGDPGGFTEDGSKSTATYGFPTSEALYGYSLISTPSMSSAMMYISKTSKNPERAMMLLNLVWADRTLSNTLAFGVEDKHYTVVSGKGTDDIYVEAKSGAEQKYAVWHTWLGPLWDQWDSNWNRTEALEVMQRNNEVAETSKILGFMFDSEPVKAEVAQVAAVVAEMQPILFTGTASDFDKYIEESKKKLLNAGADKVLAEAQKQLDAWKNTNK